MAKHGFNSVSVWASHLLFTSLVTLVPYLQSDVIENPQVKSNVTEIKNELSRSKCGRENWKCYCCFKLYFVQYYWWSSGRTYVCNNTKKEVKFVSIDIYSDWYTSCWPTTTAQSFHSNTTCRVYSTAYSVSSSYHKRLSGNVWKDSKSIESWRNQRV